MTSAANSDKTQPVIVREATTADATALAALIAELNGPQGNAEETAARLRACAGLEVALLACTPSEAVGFACLRFTPAIGTQAPHALLTELYVRESWRRHGVGQALVQEAERRTLARGAWYLYLFTGQENLAAQSFYERHGYELVGPTYRRALEP